MNKSSHIVAMWIVATILSIAIVIHESIYDPSGQPILGLILDSVMLFLVLFAASYLIYAVSWMFGKMLMRLGIIPLRK